MGRRRTVPDAEVFAEVRRLLAEGGEKAVAFSSVGRATGLAAPTLVQRYGSRDGMLRAALADAWDRLDATVVQAASDAPVSPKGAAQILKALAGEETVLPDLTRLAADLRDPALRDRAAAWRKAVEASLAIRFGGGSKGREAAAILFAAWQGQTLWTQAGGRAAKPKDIVKRLS